MRTGIFATLSNENEQMDQLAVAAEPITPEEVVEEQAEHEELQTIADETAGDIADMTEAEEVTEEVEENVAENEEKLEKPEEVTAADALVAQESLHYAVKLLGGDPVALVGSRMSHESATANPVDALKLSVENAKEFVLKILEQIKLVFKKIILSMKKLYTQAVVVLSRVEKNAIKLKDVVGKRKEAAADAAFSEKEIGSISARLGAVIVANGGTLGANPASELKGYADALKDTGYFKLMSNGIKSGGQVMAANVASTDAAAVGEEMVKNITALADTKANAYLEKVAGAIEKFDAPKDIKVGGVYAVKGTKVFFAGVAGDNAKPETVRYVAVAASAKVDAVKAIKVAIPTPGNIVALLDEVIAVAKASKPFSAAVLAEIDAADKELAAVTAAVNKASEVTAAGKLAVTRYISGVRVAVSNIGLNSILAQVDGAKAMLAYATIAAKKFPAGE